MADQTNGGATNGSGLNTSWSTNVIITGIIAVVALGFAGWLFFIGQSGIGGTIAGVVLAHYFSVVSSNNAAQQVSNAVNASTTANAASIANDVTNNTPPPAVGA